jgi:hypothetical protein
VSRGNPFAVNLVKIGTSGRERLEPTSWGFPEFGGKIVKRILCTRCVRELCTPDSDLSPSYPGNSQDSRYSTRRHSHINPYTILGQLRIVLERLKHCDLFCIGQAGILRQNCSGSVWIDSGIAAFIVRLGHALCTRRYSQNRRNLIRGYWVLLI